MMDQFPRIRFTGQLRPSQLEVVEIARRELAAGQRRLHIVAPPGSGKTVTGLYLWAECIRVPALVLSPNSAIQAQWAARLDLFDCPAGLGPIAGTDPESPRLFTSLTYQAVTLPRRCREDIDAQAIELHPARRPARPRSSRRFRLVIPLDGHTHGHETDGGHDQRRHVHVALQQRVVQAV
jgi:superfamily II DNA or RNA helicase